MHEKGVDIYRADEIFVLNVAPSFKHVALLVETLVYFKEFKAQLHYYMNLHRDIWRQVERIKEERAVRGSNVKKQRTELEGHKRTVDVLEARISEMDQYMQSRAALTKEQKWENSLSEILQFKYTNLDSAHNYVKSLWGMTGAYVDSAIELFAEIENQSTTRSVRVLTIITSFSVINLILAAVEKASLPVPRATGLYYIIILLLGSLLLNEVIKYLMSLFKYRVSDKTTAAHVHAHLGSRSR